ncbi:MAG: sensor histidine kinase [Fibrobacterota bacterium]
MPSFILRRPNKTADDGKFSSTGLSDDVLMDNACWFVQLRWLVLAVFLGMAAVMKIFGQGLTEAGIFVPPEVFLYSGFILFILNASFLYISKEVRSGNRRFFTPQSSLKLQIAVDLAVLTVMVHFLGSTGTPAPFLYVVHISLACVFFSKKSSFSVTVLSAALYLACVLAEQSGIIKLRSVFPGSFHYEGIKAFLIAVSAVFVMFAVWFVVSRLSEKIRIREQQLLEIQEDLKKSQAEKDEYAVYTTHQLKSPLDTIRSNITMILEGYVGKTDDAATDMLRRIDKKASDMGALVLDSLRLSRLKVNDGSGKSIDTPVKQIIEKSIEAVLPQIKSRKIKVLTDIEDFSVRINPEHLKMIVDNLTANAVNYSYDEGVVKIKAVSGVSSFIKISDSGIGIDPEKLPHIFEEYFKTKEAMKHNKSSSGIGLAIVKHAAELNGIDIQVESDPGRGSVFSVIFDNSFKKEKP